MYVYKAFEEPPKFSDGAVGKLGLKEYTQNGYLSSDNRGRHTYMHTYIYIYIVIHTYIHVNTYSCRRKYLYIQTCLHKFILTYIHTYIISCMHT